MLLERCSAAVIASFIGGIKDKASCHEEDGDGQRNVVGVVGDCMEVGGSG